MTGLEAELRRSRTRASWSRSPAIVPVHLHWSDSNWIGCWTETEPKSSIATESSAFRPGRSVSLRVHFALQQPDPHGLCDPAATIQALPAASLQPVVARDEH